MSWNYSGDPKSSVKDECRFIIGDIDAKHPLMQDEEIQYIIEVAGKNKNALMYQLFIRAATLFARDIKRSLGPQSEDPTSRLAFYEKQARIYKVRLTSGGISLPNYDHPQIFGVGMTSNPPYRKGAPYVQ